MTTLTASPVDELIEKARQAFDAGQLSAACKHLSRACELAPGADLALALGHMKFSAGGVFEALQEYSRAVAIDPQCAAAHASRALSLQMLGHTNDAKAAAERALALDPTQATAARVLARMRLDSQNCGGVRRHCQNILDGYVSPWRRAVRDEVATLCPA
jgi:Flp pilus assembly protein TadD